MSLFEDAETDLLQLQASVDRLRSQRQRIERLKVEVCIPGGVSVERKVLQRHPLLSDPDRRKTRTLSLTSCDGNATELPTW